MSKKLKKRLSLNDLLLSYSDDMFPEHLGKAPVTMDSVSIHGDTPLHIAVEKGNRFGVSLLVEEGADINRKGARGETPLHKAVGEFDQAMVSLLLKLGADGSVKSRDGETAEQFAKRYHSPVNFISER